MLISLKVLDHYTSSYEESEPFILDVSGKIISIDKDYIKICSIGQSVNEHEVKGLYHSILKKCIIGKPIFHLEEGEDGEYIKMRLEELALDE